MNFSNEVEMNLFINLDRFFICFIFELFFDEDEDEDDDDDEDDDEPDEEDDEDDDLDDEFDELFEQLLSDFRLLSLILDSMPSLLFEFVPRRWRRSLEYLNTFFVL